MLAWNLEAQTRLGHIGLATVRSKALRLGKGILVQPKARLHHVNLFVQMRVSEHKTKGIIWQSALELKLEPIVKCT